MIHYYEKDNFLLITTSENELSISILNEDGKLFCHEIQLLNGGNLCKSILLSEKYLFNCFENG